MLTSFDGGRLFGEVYGSGRPRILALHGWGRDHNDFRRLLSGNTVAVGSVEEGLRSHKDETLPDEALSALALDLPGFGATPAPGEAWGFREYAEAVSPVLEAMETPVVIVAHSFGGRLAVELAARNPEKVGGLLLTGCPLFPASRRRSKAPLSLRGARALSRHGLVSAQRLESLRQRHGSADYKAAKGVMRAVLVRSIGEEREEAYTEALCELCCPGVLVWGAEDTAAPPSVARRIEESYAGPVSLELVAGVGHHTPLEVPGLLRARLEELAARTS